MRKYTVIMVMLINMMVNMGWSQNAPVTKAETVLNPVNGSTVLVAVTVTGFSGIGSFSLALDYNPAVVTLTNAMMHPVFQGCSADWTTTPGRIYLTWQGTNGVTLPENSHLADIAFSFPFGGSTFLSWFDNGISCQYARFVSGGTYIVLNDTPQSSFYINGLICGDAAPVTIAPVVTNAVEGPLDIGIMTTGFEDIGAISLTFQYDPTVLTFQDFYSPNLFLSANGSFMVSTYPGTGGYFFLSVSWIKNAGPGVPVISLPDSSQLLNLLFDYTDDSKVCFLRWIDNGGSCEYANGNLDVMWDLPTPTFYKDGLVTWQRNAPKTIVPDLPATGETVCVPVSVTDFTDIGAISLTLDYDPAVLDFLSVSPDAIPSGWDFTGQATTPGRLIVTGVGPSLSLSGGSDVLFNACFNYLGGASLMRWYDDGTSSEYADGSTLEPLYDSPADAYYINGFIGPYLAAQFIASDTAPAKNSNVTLTDLSSGDPLLWTWTFNPSGPVIFVNGTNATSQNPQVQFTAGGSYSISLLVTGISGISTMTKPAYIVAGTPGLWTGTVSSEWADGSNWDNSLTPNGSIDVFIPSFSPNWPVFQGNLTIGVQCRSLYLGNMNSRLTVTGNLTVN